MLNGDTDPRDGDAIVKAARLRIEAARTRRAVQDAEFRLQCELDASRRAEASARDTLHLPPKADDRRDR